MKIDNLIEDMIDSIPIKREELFIKNGKYEPFILKFHNLDELKNFFRQILELGKFVE